MNDETRLDRRLPQVLADLGAGRSPDYTESILARTAATRQRPGWVFPERWLPMSALTQRMTAVPRLSWRAVAVIALIVLALASAALYAGSRQRHLPTPFGPAANGGIPYVSGGDVFVGDPVTGKTRLLIGGPEADAYPQFSPDGTHVAFIRDVGDATVKPVDIYVVQDDGSDLRKITPEPLRDVASISWTPDSRGIAVVSSLDAATSKLDVYDSAGTGSIRTIATVPGMDFVQFRPPAGDALLYRVNDRGAAGLYAMDADGSHVRPLVLSSHPGDNDYWGGATWSADGSRIFYTRPFAQPTSTGACCSLWVMNADGSDPREFIPNDGTAWDGQPTVSPDGKMVAFWNGHVSVVRVDGTGPVIQTGPELQGTRHWVWSPDSSKILMIPDDGGTQAYLLDPNGGPWTTVPWNSETDLDWQRVAGD